MIYKINLNNKIDIEEIQKLAFEGFGDMVKAVVDINKKEMTIEGELHSDEESILMNNKSYYHKELADGRWFEFSLAQQLGNTGSEINRAMNHFEKNNNEAGLNAFYRGLELLDLTISDPRLRHRLKEINRLREVLCDRFLGDNIYKLLLNS